MIPEINDSIDIKEEDIDVVLEDIFDLAKLITLDDEEPSKIILSLFIGSFFKGIKEQLEFLDSSSE